MIKFNLKYTKIFMSIKEVSFTKVYLFRVLILLSINYFFHENLSAQCTELNQQFDATLEIRRELKEKRRYVTFDSILNHFISKYEKFCPCSYNYGKIVDRSVNLTFYALRNPKKALDIFAQAIEKCKNTNDTTTLFLLQRKAVYHLRSDDFYGMKKYLDEAIEIGIKKFHPSHTDFFKARNNLGLYHHWLRDFSKALEIHAYNEKLVENTISMDTSERINNLTWCYKNALELNDIHNADTYIIKLKVLTNGTKYEKDLTQELNEVLLDYYIKIEDYENANTYFQMVDTTAYNDYFRALPLIRYLIHERKEDEAAQRLQKLDTILDKNEVPSHHFVRINVDIEKMKLSKISNETFKTLAQKVTSTIHNNYINLINCSPKDQADNIALVSSKYVTLTNIILEKNSQLDLFSVYDRMNNIKNASNTYYRNLQFHIQRTKDEPLKNNFDSYKKLAMRVEEKNVADSLNLLSSLIQEALMADGVKWHNNISIEDIQQKLKTNEIFLDFYQTDKIKGKEELYLFAVTSDKLSFVNYKNIVDTLSLELTATNYTNNGKKNKALYNYLIKPIEYLINGKSKMYISPDGLLNQIAIEVLSNTGSEKDILEDQFDIVYIENSRTLIDGENPLPFTKSNQYLLVGGIDYTCHSKHQEAYAYNQEIQKNRSEIQYLEGSFKEVIQISEKLKTSQVNCLLKTKCEASKDSIIEAVGKNQFSYIHISTHGLIDDKKTSNLDNYFTQNNNAQILLAKSSENDDAALSAIEIINQDLSSKELIFLSACNTGQGTYMSGFGNASVANAFKKAGAKKVIATLWPIPDDVTVELCDHFYTHYLKSNDANAAMQYAKKILRTKYSPEQWAAFRVMN